MNNKTYNYNFSKYYDIMYKKKNYIRECDIIEQIIRNNFNTNNLSLLDIGCGTGTHAIEMARRGLQVTAIDTSLHMIQIAINKDKDKVRFVCGNFKNDINERYDVVVSLFNVVNCLESYSHLINYFKSVANKMKENALFLFDSWNGLATLRRTPTEKLNIINHNDIRIFRHAFPETNLIEQVCQITYKIFVYESGKIKDEFQSIHRIKLYTPEQILDALEGAGFETLQKFVGMDMEKEVNENNAPITFVCKRTRCIY